MNLTSVPANFQCDMVMTLGVAVVLLMVGIYVKKHIPVLERFFIPAPVIGGLIFACITLVGHLTGSFNFTFDDQLKNLLMTAFFTTIGFTASARMLVTGGVGIMIFLAASTVLISAQNGLGIFLCSLFDLPPLMGLALGSIPLTGGFGTAAAFGPVLEGHGIDAAMSVSIAAATFGLVAGSMIGGPVAKRILQHFTLRHSAVPPDENFDMSVGKLTRDEKTIDVNEIFTASACIIISMGLGAFLIDGFKALGLVLPSYLGPMLVAALMRNIWDFTGHHLPLHTINILGAESLQFFLAMALMGMRLWELADLAVPLVSILLLQTLLVGTFAYLVTFWIMGRDYDAAVIACGHCGFGLGATPNAMANMEAFTAVNGPSPKAFFVVPLVGALFIDFVNAIIITSFMNIFS